MALKAGTEVHIPFNIGATELAAGTVFDMIAPIDGVIEILRTTVQTAIGTGGVLTVKTGDALATTVAGLAQTIADSATKGTRQNTTSTAGSSTRVVTAGTRVGIEPSAAFASAGAMSGILVFRSADVSPALPAV